MVTRVDTFSIILIIDRSRARESLPPLGSFLFTVEGGGRGEGGGLIERGGAY